MGEIQVKSNGKVLFGEPADFSCKISKEPRTAFFASFLGSKKEAGSGTASQCCRLRVEKAKPIISRVKSNVRSGRSRRFRT